MFKTDFSVHKKIGKGAAPECPPWLRRKTSIPQFNIQKRSYDTGLCSTMSNNLHYILYVIWSFVVLVFVSKHFSHFFSQHHKKIYQPKNCLSTYCLSVVT